MFVVSACGPRTVGRERGVFNLAGLLMHEGGWIAHRTNRVSTANLTFYNLLLLRITRKIRPGIILNTGSSIRPRLVALDRTLHFGEP